MFEIVVSCSGLPESMARDAIAEILEESSQRTWHENVICWWEGDLLYLRVRNDCDVDGSALAHEFSDVVCACTPIQDEIAVSVVSVAVIPGSDA